MRKGEVIRVLDSKNPKAFLVPFKDKLGATITLESKTFTSDKLFINNGPDYLYKITYTIKYDIVNPKTFYPILNKFDSYAVDKINDDLRLFSEKNGADLILKNYLDNKGKIIETLNKFFKNDAIRVIDFKISAIEPIGSKNNN